MTHKTETRARVVEYHVATSDMSKVRRHRYEADYSTGKVNDILEEWTWNYSQERYNCYRNAHMIDVTENGTVEHSGRDLRDHAEERVETLTQARFQSGKSTFDLTTEQTELVVEPAPAGGDEA